MEPPGLLHRHCRVGLGRQVPFFLSLSVVIYGSAQQALGLGSSWFAAVEAGGWLVSLPLVFPSQIPSRDHSRAAAAPLVFSVV